MKYLSTEVMAVERALQRCQRLAVRLLMVQEHHILPNMLLYTAVCGANDTLVGHKATKPTGAKQATRDLQALPELILIVKPHQIAKRLLMSSSSATARQNPLLCHAATMQPCNKHIEFSMSNRQQWLLQPTFAAVCELQCPRQST
jgi:hypothetical protein